MCRLTILFCWGVLSSVTRTPRRGALTTPERTQADWAARGPHQVYIFRFSRLEYSEPLIFASDEAQSSLRFSQKTMFCWEIQPKTEWTHLDHKQSYNHIRGQTRLVHILRFVVVPENVFLRLISSVKIYLPPNGLEITLVRMRYP